MALLQQINDDLKTAMKSGARERVEVLRFTLSGFNNTQKEKKCEKSRVSLSRMKRRSRFCGGR